MTTVSNQLQPSAFFSAHSLAVTPTVSPTISPFCQTNEEVRFVVQKPLKTPNPSKIESLMVLAVPRGSEIGDWRLESVVLVQLRRGRRQWVATTWLEGMAEYGAGDTVADATADLVTSLGEYRVSLEKRENRLEASAQVELAHLRRLIERIPIGEQIAPEPVPDDLEPMSPSEANRLMQLDEAHNPLLAELWRDNMNDDLIDSA